MLTQRGISEDGKTNNRNRFDRSGGGVSVSRIHELRCETRRCERRCVLERSGARRGQERQEQYGDEAGEWDWWIERGNGGVPELDSTGSDHGPAGTGWTASDGTGGSSWERYDQPQSSEWNGVQRERQVPGLPAGQLDLAVEYRNGTVVYFIRDGRRVEQAQGVSGRMWQPVGLWLD